MSFLAVNLKKGIESLARWLGFICNWWTWWLANQIGSPPVKNAIDYFDFDERSLIWCTNREVWGVCFSMFIHWAVYFF